MTHFEDSVNHQVTSYAKKGSICMVSITRSEQCQIQIAKDELAIFIILKGELNFQSKYEFRQIKECDGLIVNQFGLPKFSFQAEPFEGVLIKVGLEPIQKLLSMIRYKPHEIPIAVTPNQLLFPKSESLSLFLRSIGFYANPATTAFPDSIYESKLLELFWILNSSDVKKDFDSIIYPFIVPDRTFLDSIMERYYKKNLALSQFASIAGYSISTFKRKFEETYQCSPGRWVQNRRLMEAKFLLETTNKTISEIGYEVGFESSSHFIQSFKLKFGTTPKRLQQSKNAA